MADKKVTRELAIFINDRQVTNSLAGVTREIGKVNAEMRNLNKNSATYDEDLKKLQKDLAALRDRQSEFKDEIAATNEISLEAQESISQIFMGLSTGNLNMAKDGLLAIRANLAGMVSSALAFVATPFGATLATLAGIVYVTKQWIDYNNSIRENTRLIENLTGKTGQIVNDIRNTITGLSETFDVEFKAIAGAVDNLIDTGVAKNELEALDKIKNGLLKAPDKNEFLASLESSAIVAKQLGIDLDEVIALKEAIENNGVDPEKVFGALQKATKNLSEQSDSLRKTLSNALGAAFTDEILQKVRTGEITVNEALLKIADRSKEVGLNIKQQAELTTAVFGKAGVAAGGLETITKSLTEAQKAQGQELTAIQKATKELADSQIELTKAQDDLLASESFEVWKTNVMKSINTVKTGFYQLVNQIISGRKAIDEQITKNSQDKAIEQTKADAVKQFEQYIASLSKSIGKGFNFDSATGSYLKSLNESLARAKKEKDDFEARSLQAEIDAVKAYAEERSAKQKEINEGEIREEKQKAVKIKEVQDDAAKKKAAADEQLRKEQLEKEQALLNAKIRLAKAELDFFLISNKTKLESGQKLTDELVQQEVQRLQKIQEQRQIDLNNAKLIEIEKAKTSKKSTEELNILLAAIDKEFNTKKIELDAQTTDAILAVRRQKEEQDKQLRAEQLAYDYELALMEAQTKDEQDRITQQKKYDDDLANYKKALNEKQITEDEFRRFKNALDEKQEVLDRQRQLNQINSVLGGMSSLSNALTELFGQSKEMAYASALINGAQAITSILAQWPKFDGGISMSLAIAAAGVSTLAQLRKISTTKEPKKTNLKEISQPGFFYGGDTGNFPALGYDRFGAVTGVVHEDEWVAPKWMKQTPRYARTIQWLESERQRVMKNGFAQGGNVGTSSPQTMVNVTDNSTVRLEMLLEKLNAAIDRGIMAKVFFGYEDAQAVSDLLDEKNQSQSNGTLNS